MTHAPIPVLLPFFAVVLSASVLLAQEPQGGAPDTVVAVVGAQEIRTSDLLAEVNRQIPLISYHRKVSPEKLAEARKTALSKLVEKALIHQDAVDRKIEVDEEQIRAEFRSTLERAEKTVTETEFEALLSQYRPLVLRRILLDRNEERFVAALPKVQPEQLTTAYEQMLATDPESLMSPAETHLQHIFIAVDPASSAAVFDEKKERANAAHKMIVDGKSFAEVAGLYSEDEYAEKGGDMGVVQKANIRNRTVSDAAFALADGELSTVIRSLYGYHIMRCVKVMPRRQLTLEDVRPMLEAWWTAEHRKRAREAWLAELRERYGVEVLDPRLAGEAGEAKSGTPEGKATSQTSSGR